MAEDNIAHFPPPAGPPEFMIGPFTEYRVVIEGRKIPHLTAFNDGDGVALVIDNRLSVTVPKDRAYDICWLIANAMAVAQGYPCLSSENKDQPFAPQCIQIGGLPNQPSL